MARGTSGSSGSQPGNRAARSGVVTSAEIDTAHFKGNYPDRVMLEAAMFGDDGEATLAKDSADAAKDEATLAKEAAEPAADKEGAGFTKDVSHGPEGQIFSSKYVWARHVVIVEGKGEQQRVHVTFMSRHKDDRSFAGYPFYG